MFALERGRVGVAGNTGHQKSISRIFSGEELGGLIMAMPRIKFTHGNRQYTVNQKALDKGKILLPDGTTLLSITQKRLGSDLSISQKDLQPEKMPPLFKGMIAVQLAPLVGAVLAEERMD